MTDAVNNINPHQDSTSGQADPVPDALDNGMTRARQSPVAGWLGSSAAELLGPQLVLATQDQGYAAALNGDPLDACPWRATQNDQERALRQMWIRGYSAGRTDLRIARDPAESPGDRRQSPPANRAGDRPHDPLT